MTPTRGPPASGRWRSSSTPTRVDPVGDEARTTELVERYVEAGATVLNLRFKAPSVEHCLDQLEAMAQRPEFTPRRRLTRSGSARR